MLSEIKLITIDNYIDFNLIIDENVYQIINCDQYIEQAIQTEDSQA